jgi:hypothetical protein
MIGTALHRCGFWRLLVLVPAVLSLAMCAAPPARTVPAAVPSPDPRAAEAQTSEERGRALIARAVAAMGGAKVVDGVVTLGLTGKARRVFPGGQEIAFDSRTMIQLSGAVRQELDLPFGKLVTVWTPKQAFTDMGDGPVLLPDAQGAEIESGFRRNLIALLQARTQADFRAVDLGPTRVGAAAAEEVEVTQAGLVTKLAIEPATGFILASRYVTPMEARSTARESVTEYSSYALANGLSYPFSTSTSINGELSLAVKLEKVEVNRALEPTLFLPKTAPVSPDVPAAPSPEAPPLAAPPPATTPHA